MLPNGCESVSKERLEASMFIGMQAHFAAAFIDYDRINKLDETKSMVLI